jgi:hypothetical protein
VNLPDNIAPASSSNEAGTAATLLKADGVNKNWYMLLAVPAVENWTSHFLPSRRIALKEREWFKAFHSECLTIPL